MLSVELLGAPALLGLRPHHSCLCLHCTWLPSAVCVHTASPPLFSLLHLNLLHFTVTTSKSSHEFGKTLIKFKGKT